MSLRGIALLGCVTSACSSSPSVQDPVHRECLAILDRAAENLTPALTKLGLTDRASEIKQRFVLDALSEDYNWKKDENHGVLFLKSCAEMTPAQRSCLLAAKTKLEFESCESAPSLTLPRIANVHALLDARLHPVVDPAPILAKLVGTWVRDKSSSSSDTTWTISASGELVRFGDQSARLDLRQGGYFGDEVALRYVIASDDVFYADDTLDAAPITSRDRFVVRFEGGFLVREPAGCWSVTASGDVSSITCKETETTLEVSVDSRTFSFTYFPGWIAQVNERQRLDRRRVN